MGFWLALFTKTNELDLKFLREIVFVKIKRILFCWAAIAIVNLVLNYGCGGCIGQFWQIIVSGFSGVSWRLPTLIDLMALGIIVILSAIFVLGYALPYRAIFVNRVKTLAKEFPVTGIGRGLTYGIFFWIIGIFVWSAISVWYFGRPEIIFDGVVQLLVGSVFGGAILGFGYKDR